MDPPLEPEWGDEGTQLGIATTEDRESDSNESVDRDYEDCERYQEWSDFVHDSDDGIQLY